MSRPERALTRCMRSTARPTTWSCSARTMTGYRNLSYMVSRGFHRRLLQPPARGHGPCCGSTTRASSALSACLAGRASRSICMQGDYDAAKAAALEHSGDLRAWDHYLSSSSRTTSLPEQPKVNQRLAAAWRRRDGAAARRDERRALSAAGGRENSGRSHVHPDGEDRRRYEPPEI